MSSIPRYLDDARRSVAMPLGGIGTGHVAICGDGSLRQWQLTGTPNHDGYVPASFFAIRASGVEPPLNVARGLSSAIPTPSEPAPNVTDHMLPFDADPPSQHWREVTS